jgi:hypothetical protein
MMPYLQHFHDIKNAAAIARIIPNVDGSTCTKAERALEYDDGLKLLRVLSVLQQGKSSCICSVVVVHEKRTEHMTRRPILLLFILYENKMFQ